MRKNLKAPKIYVLPNVKSVENYVKFQRLPKFSYEFLKNEVNRENINSEYIISNMIEPVYYELLTEYLKKIVIMGYFD